MPRMAAGAGPGVNLLLSLPKAWLTGHLCSTVSELAFDKTNQVKTHRSQEQTG